jgi:hypothetical protein
VRLVLGRSFVDFVDRGGDITGLKLEFAAAIGIVRASITRANRNLPLLFVAVEVGA